MTKLPPPQSPVHPTFSEAFFVWLKIGLMSFGGPTGQIALMHDEVVEKRRWVSDERFLHALNYCMLLPGPEAQQLSVYIGWLLHRTWGGIVAGALFILPGALLLGLISWVYVSFGKVPWIDALFYGLKPAVIAIVCFAVYRIGKKTLRNAMLWGIAVAAFLAIYYLGIPFPYIIIGAGLVGLAGGCWAPSRFRLDCTHRNTTDHTPRVIGDTAMADVSLRPTLGGTIRTVIIWSILWCTPVAISWMVLGKEHVLTAEGIFFSKAAVVTFGGAYSVLPFVGQQAVEHYGWLAPAQMMDGMALAETTPGPLILVLQFVGFLGAYHAPAPFTPMTAAILGAAMTTWTTFIPSFLFVLVGAPFIEVLRGQKLLTYALTAITAAVVGVILNLAVWFAMQVLFPATMHEPGAVRVDWYAVICSGIALLGLVRFKWNTLAVIFGCAVLGLAYRTLQ
ncbi:MAG: chromate efflux transporter [Verrucomicrobiota bacterium]|nr:chromate efflux transporter [Verrucomicrobiota bacterium]